MTDSSETLKRRLGAVPSLPVEKAPKVRDWVSAAGSSNSAASAGVGAELEDAPGPHGYYPAVNYGPLVPEKDVSALGNMQFGDCVPAALIHHWQWWAAKKYGETRNAMAAKLVEPTTEEALSLYKIVNPAWNKADPATDTGCQPVDVFNYAMRYGVVIGGMRRLLAGFAEIEPDDLSSLKFAIEHGVGVMRIWNMPKTAETTNDWIMDDPVWLPGVELIGAAAPGSWGPHATYTLAHNENYFTTLSWGEEIHFTGEWAMAYGLRHYMLVWNSESQFGNLDVMRLKADLIELRNGLPQS